jgi:hypothetical protein
MTLRRFIVLVLISFLSPLTGSAAERFVTENFIVTAPTQELAEKFGQYAEHYRKEKAIDWLGHEMPRWPDKCPLKVQITVGRTGGATTFTFGVDSNRRPSVLSQEMKIFGEVKQLITSVLPHEVTHTVLAHHFGQAVPRWADEGGSVLSENDEERFTHDVRCREILNQGRGIPLRHLFRMTEYPSDMIVVYAQGYSVCQFLIDQEGGKKKFLEFVGAGMRSGNRNWEEAVQMYGYASPDELQEAWIKHLRNPPQRIAARNQNQDAPRGGNGTSTPVASLTGRSGSRGLETRSSAIPGMPMLEPPVVARGQAGDDRRTEQGFEPSNSVSNSDSPPIPRLLPPEPASRSR